MSKCLAIGFSVLMMVILTSFSHPWYPVSGAGKGRCIPSLGEQGWEGTVLVYPGERVKVIANFEYKGIYVCHCHILEHDDAGMIGTFEVKWNKKA